MDFIVVGAGWAGERHVRAIRALASGGADTRVAGIVDVDPEHLAEKADAWTIDRTFARLPDALGALPDARAVVLATPHHLHREGTEQAAAAGRHVLVEKPMALSLADADAMIAACDAASITLMVAESIRYQRITMEVAEALRAGKIGQVLAGRMNMIGRGRQTYAYAGRRAWLADPSVSGSGLWMLNGIHKMSAARMFFGELKRIDAREVHSDGFESELEATVVALLTFDSGAVVTMTVSAELHGYKRYNDLVIFGSRGTLDVLWRGAEQIAIYTEGDPETIPCAESPRENAEGHFVRQMKEFISAIEENREPLTGGPSERRTLEAILAGYESMRTGGCIAL